MNSTEGLEYIVSPSNKDKPQIIHVNKHLGIPLCERPTSRQIPEDRVPRIIRFYSAGFMRSRPISTTRTPTSGRMCEKCASNLDAALHTPYLWAATHAGKAKYRAPELGAGGDELMQLLTNLNEPEEA